MGIRVNIDLDVDSIFDEEFQTEINRHLRSVVRQALHRHIDEEIVRVIQDNSQQLSETIIAEYQENHQKLMDNFKG